MIQNSINPYEYHIAAAQKGSHQSFGILYDKYAPVLMGIIKRIINNDELSEKILIKSFVKMWQQATSYDPLKSSLFTWISNMARQTAFEEASYADQIKPKATDAVYNVQNDHFNKEPANNKQKQLLAFELLYNKGLNCTEAAAVLNITVAELKQNIRLAIKTMKGIKHV